MEKIKPLKPFYCQKVLPLTYDNSLSYYEIICKLLRSLNLTIENVNELGASYQQLYEFVINYFDNLDLQEEIDRVINELIDSGEFWRYFVGIIGFVTPTMYGAKGDGVTDDSQAFVDCFAEGRPVRIFRGRYEVLTDIISVDKQEVMCDWDAYIDTNEPIYMYDGKWKGGAVTSQKTGFVLVRGECRLQDTRVHVSGATANGVSCMGGYSLLDDLLIDGHETAYMGVWSDNGSQDQTANMNILRVHNCTIKNFRLNGIFSSAISTDIAYCTLTNNHIATEPQGGGQIDIVGKYTQGYATVRNNVISLAADYRTSGVEIDWSGNAEVFANVINMTGSQMYGVVLQNASHASVHDNTIIGGFVGIGSITNTKNILNTQNNWMSGCTHNFHNGNEISIISLDEERYTGDLIYNTADHLPIMDINNGYFWTGQVEQNQGCNFYVSGVHNMKFIVERTVEVQDEPMHYNIDVIVDDDNGVVFASDLLSNFSFADHILTYGNNTLGQTVNVYVMTVN